MPTRSDILFQIRDAERQGYSNPYDTIRRHYMNVLHNYTGRNIILYSTAWTQGKGTSQNRSITNSDVHAFMEVIYGLDSDELDLILHSPGGSPVATEQIVDYIRAKFSDVRVFVPQAAMSAATLLCCAADEVVMGTHSSLGPIDPQFTVRTPNGPRQVGAHAVLSQFERARGEVDSQSELSAWLPILQQYSPGFLSECEDAIDLSKSLAKEWATKHMHASGSHKEALAEQMSSFLSDRSQFMNHGRRISRSQARDNGFNVSALEDDQDLQDHILSIFHATMHSHQNKPLVKILENHRGRNVMEVNATNPQSQSRGQIRQQDSMGGEDSDTESDQR